MPAPRLDRTQSIRPALESHHSQSDDAVIVDVDEAALITRVQRGDHEAFGALAKRHAARAFVVAFRVMRHRQDAEDLVQDAFLAALNKIASFDTSRPFAPWFLRIVLNRGLNARQSRAVRERRVQLAGAIPLDDTSPTLTTAPDTEVERREIRERFAAAMRQLSERRRLIVQLSDVDELTSQEIADVVALPAGTVRWHLHEARRTLRAAMRPLADSPAGAP
ncbi:MAG: RNA polymerase sigma factor [Gemmatimonadaceae bacterium]